MLESVCKVFGNKGYPCERWSADRSSMWCEIILKSTLLGGGIWVESQNMTKEMKSSSLDLLTQCGISLVRVYSFSLLITLG